MNARYIKDISSGATLGILVTVSDSSNYVVPLDPANTDYQNIMKLVEDGELEIAEAENNDSSGAAPL